MCVVFRAEQCSECGDAHAVNFGCSVPSTSPSRLLSYAGETGQTPNRDVGRKEGTKGGQHIFWQGSTNRIELGFHQCIESVFLSGWGYSSTNWLCFRFSVWGTILVFPLLFLTDCGPAILQASQSVSIFHHDRQTDHTLMWPCAPYSCHPGTSVLTLVSSWSGYVLFGDSGDTAEHKMQTPFPASL